MFNLAALPLLLFATPQQTPITGSWQAHLQVEQPGQSPAATLDFGLELVKQADGWSAFLINDPERIPVPHVLWDGESLLLSIDHYDSKIEAKLQGQRLVGSWNKVRGKDKLARVPFWAERPSKTQTPKRAVLSRNIAGRWAMNFSSDELGSVGIFTQQGEQVRGTVLNATGDYRYLAGSIEGKSLRLSCFDGAHAFLFEAELAEDGGLAGSFRSGNWWQETWTAKRDDAVQMVDGFEQTKWDYETCLAELNFIDADGKLRSLAEPGFLGKATIVQLFGTWCPNCHDETRYLVELSKRYGERGLRIVGLAFELSGELQRDLKQLEVFRKRHAVPYPLLLAGTANKQEASLAFPAIDRLRSFPTSIFIDQTGQVRGLHSGFSGPATGAEHQALREHYEAAIEGLLSEEPAPQQGGIARLDGSIWQQPAGRMRVEFHVDEGGQLLAEHTPMGPLGAPSTRKDAPKSQSSPVTLRGDALFFGGFPWRLDERVGSLAQTQDYGLRLFELGAPASRVVRELAGISTDDLLYIAANPEEPLIRREEALRSVAFRGVLLPLHAAKVLALLDDDSHRVRMAALYTLGKGQHAGAKQRLIEHLKHPNAAERREAVDALMAIGALAPELKLDCAELWPTIDQTARKMLR